MGDYPPIGRVTEADMQAEVWKEATRGFVCPIYIYESCPHNSDPCISKKRTKEERDALCAKLGPYCWRWLFEELAIRHGATVYPGTEVHE